MSTPAFLSACRMTGGVVHQGVAAQAAAHTYASVEEILQLAKDRGEDPLLILLDGLEDPHNLGAIMRSAECAGAHGVVAFDGYRFLYCICLPESHDRLYE